jgi:hypothetical protein
VLLEGLLPYTWDGLFLFEETPGIRLRFTEAREDSTGQGSILQLDVRTQVLPQLHHRPAPAPQASLSTSLRSVSLLLIMVNTNKALLSVYSVVFTQFP